MVLMLYPMAYCAFALMECAFGYPFAPSMLSFVILFFAAIELAPVPMSVSIILPLILCTMHSESADIALAGIVNILAVIHTLHIVAYLTFALMARSYAFPISPIMLGLVFGPIAAFLGACVPMVYLIITPFIAKGMLWLYTITADFARHIMISRFYFVAAFRGTMALMVGSVAFPFAPLVRVYTITADCARYIMVILLYFFTAFCCAMTFMVGSMTFPCAPLVLMLFAFCQRTAADDNRLHKQQRSHNYGRQPMFSHCLSPYSWFIG